MSKGREEESRESKIYIVLLEGGGGRLLQKQRGRQHDMRSSCNRIAKKRAGTHGELQDRAVPNKKQHAYGTEGKEKDIVTNNKQKED